MVDAPVVVEQPGINTPEKAQSVPVPCVACGRVEALENVDYYRFTAKAGQVLSFEVFCARIQDKIHDLQKHADPMLKLYDANGRELADCDDCFFADPCITHTFKEPGDYFVEVRDAKYDGDPRWAYALSITDHPRAVYSFPLAVLFAAVITVEMPPMRHLPSTLSSKCSTPLYFPALSCFLTRPQLLTR